MVQGLKSFEKTKVALLAALVFLFSWHLFLACAASTPPLDDSPETTLVCATLSIGHPGGYPLHLLLGRLACLVPLGQAGLRMAFFAAALAALNVALLAALCMGLCQQQGLPSAAVLGLCCGLLLARGQVFFCQSISPKGSLYQLQLLLILASFALILFWGATQRSLRLLFLITGLGLANHWRLHALFLPFFGIALIWHPRQPLRDLRLALGALPFVFFGLALWPILLVRANLHPALNWGDMQGLTGLIHYILRLYYSPSMSELALNARFLECAFALRSVAMELGTIPLALAAWGIFRWRKEQGMAVPLLLAVLLLVPLIIASAQPLVPERYFFLPIYALPALACAVLLAGLGLGRLVASLAPAWRNLGLGCFFLLLCLAGSVRQQRYGLQDSYVGKDYVDNFFQFAPAKSLAFVSGDGPLFSLWQAQRLEGRRPDLVFLPVAMIRDAWIGNAVLAQRPELRWPPAAPSQKEMLQAIFNLNVGQAPLIYADKAVEEILGPQQFQLLPYGGFFVPYPPGKAAHRKGDLLYRQWQALNQRNWELVQNDPGACYFFYFVEHALLLDSAKLLYAAGLHHKANEMGRQSLLFEPDALGPNFQAWRHPWAQGLAWL